MTVMTTTTMKDSIRLSYVITEYALATYFVRKVVDILDQCDVIYQIVQQYS